MSRTHIHMPSGRCRFGIGRCDITPPVGIYHRFWGAAAHDRASGVHRPLTATVVLFEPNSGRQGQSGPIVIAIDHCLLRPSEMQQVLGRTAELTGVEQSRLVFTFSHTHSGGNISTDRLDMPGGDLIRPYLAEIPRKIADAYRTARKSMQPAVLNYGNTPCPMGHNRDYWDEEHGRFVCGYNPEEATELDVRVVRVADEAGRMIATFVNYACHPTTLAWQNTLISPDYVGALREVVEEKTAVPCVFLLAPCGDIGPRYGFVGDPSVADRNGRQVGYAALSVLEGLPPSGTDYHYNGPVVSGATLGEWEYRPLSESGREQAARLRYRHWQIKVPYRKGLPKAETVRRELADFLSEEKAARAAGNEQDARRARAMAERRRRLLGRIDQLPAGPNYPVNLWAWQMGDALWLAVESEPYHFLQAELNRRFPDTPLIIATIANGSPGCYFPEKDDYGKPLYQAEIALLAPGCLEAITDAFSKQIAEWIKAT